MNNHGSNSNSKAMQRSVDAKFTTILIAITIIFSLMMVVVLIALMKKDDSTDKDYTSDVAEWTKDIAEHSEASELRNTFINNVTRFVASDGIIDEAEYNTIAYDYKLLKEHDNITRIEGSLMKMRARDGVPLLLGSDEMVDLPFEVQPEPAIDQEDSDYDNNDEGRAVIDEEQAN